jgi:hypothetical protein
VSTEVVAHALAGDGDDELMGSESSRLLDDRTFVIPSCNSHERLKSPGSAHGDALFGSGRRDRGFVRAVLTGGSSTGSRHSAQPGVEAYTVKPSSWRAQ